MEINEKINELERQLNELKASLKEEAKDDRPITERVKTFKDACKVLGDNHQFVSEWSVVSEITNISPDLRAYFKLRIITAALNEGWEPEFTEGEYRYFSTHLLYTQAEYDDLPDDEKRQLVLFRGSAYNGADCGLACAYSFIAWSRSTSSLGSRLAYKTKELANYSARQFVDIWADFYLIRK